MAGFEKGPSRMIAPENQQAPNQPISLDSKPAIQPTLKQTSDTSENLKELNRPAYYLPAHLISHHPNAGLNPLVDVASYLFSLIGKLKKIKSYRLNQLQEELIQEITTFQEAVKNLGYSPEYIMVCRYIIAAMFDDLISNTTWGGHQWENYSLLAAFKQNKDHSDKFFNILDRAIKEPSLYIDLMEFIYICLSLGYKGNYRATEYGQFQLEQITNNLYKRIKTYRGSFSKKLSNISVTSSKIYLPASNALSLIFIFILTASLIMAIFISLGYLMDVISNEAYQNLKEIESSVSGMVSEQQNLS